MIDPVIELSLRLALALLFASAAWHKIGERARLRAIIRAYGVLPARLVSSAARVLPCAEALIAVGLVCPSTRHAAAWASIGLLGLYTGAIAINLVRGRREIDCGCFASSARVPLGNWLIARNGALIAAAGVLILPVAARSVNWIDGLTVAMALVTLSLLWTAGQRLAQTGPALRLGGAP